jgi:hypothetical protein
MDDNLYDEFGNYTGPDIPELNDSLSEEEEIPDQTENDEGDGSTIRPLIVSHNPLF